MDKLSAWLCLKSLPELRLRGILELLARYPDPVTYVGEPSHPLYSDPQLSPAVKDHLREGVLPAKYPQISKLCAHYGINLLCYSEEDYPEGLRSIVSPPLILYYRGDLPQALRQICLAVVGTRKPTAYGKSSCAKLLEPVCAQAVTIVSGLAMGIDTAAHTVALRQKALTIAVLASGVDIIYPAQNMELAAQIVSSGALVSEYDPGTKPDAWNFPTRNRLISALSQQVFIVEGPLSSGAMLTAKFALEQGRDVLALPGEITHPNAQGPNYLIKNGAACITCPEDVLSALGLECEAQEQLEILPQISSDEQTLYDLFQSEQRELSFDELLLRTGHGFGKLSTVLLNLELKGYINRSSGNSYILA